jgi:hypothetical protein
MDGFKAPEQTPQDLLLIHDLIAISPVPSTQFLEPSIPIDDNIASSGSENDSEDEIVNLVVLGETGKFDIESTSKSNL